MAQKNMNSYLEDMHVHEIRQETMHHSCYRDKYCME